MLSLVFYELDFLKMAGNMLGEWSEKGQAESSMNGKVEGWRARVEKLALNVVILH